MSKQAIPRASTQKIPGTQKYEGVWRDTSDRVIWSCGHQHAYRDFNRKGAPDAAYECACAARVAKYGSALQRVFGSAGPDA